MQNNLRKHQFWALNRVAFCIWNRNDPNYGIHSSIKSRGFFQYANQISTQSISGILSWDWVHRLFQTQKKYQWPQILHVLCPLPNINIVCQIWDVEMLGKDKEPSTISKILILLRILRFNLYFGTRSHIFPARLLPSINKPRTLLLVGSRKLSPIFTVAMATQIKI